jgi:hypothetical protein
MSASYVVSYIYQPQKGLFKPRLLPSHTRTARLKIEFRQDRVLFGDFAVFRMPEGYEALYPTNMLTVQACEVLYRDGLLWTTAGGFIPHEPLSIREVHHA